MDTVFATIEEKWRQKWKQAEVFKSTRTSQKKKFYVLEMFPYPSGTGLHMGHALNYSIGDTYARYKRMCGFEVFYPMGFDSFGLPAENAAIKSGEHPQLYTEQAITNYIRQMQELGLSYDWSRMLETHKPEYYRWDQWIFLQLFKKGLAYKKKSAVNWCPKCDTVLANEQVQGGKCWRHEETDVEVKQLEQWYFKTTAYADELYEGLQNLTEWPDLIKKAQRNWIGKSKGTEIDFSVNGESWPVFTTRPDTLFGVTFLVVSAQHPKLSELVTTKQKKSVDTFLKKLHSVSEKDIETLEKEGVFTGSYAEHPITKQKIPIWAGNFVVADYGSGMVMAVPAHDQRDFMFAKKYAIPIVPVIQPVDFELDFTKEDRAYTGEGTLCNSQEFNGVANTLAKEKITTYLTKHKLGKSATNFRLKDWLISRQRFWGAPIPIIYCDHCGTVPVPEKDLPVKLPMDVKFGKGNPLATSKSFFETKCPICGKNARRETDTMDTFVNSSWYYLRYTDSQNSKAIFSPTEVNYWCPVDLYIGGKEHACLHLIYIRFYTKFLRDLGLLEFDEPAIRLFNQGMLHGPDGDKMSKSKGNVINPDEVSEKYGMDTARLFLFSLASQDKDISWSEKGISGSYRFMHKLLSYFETVKIGKSDLKLESKLHETIRDVTKYIEQLQYNLAVIKLRSLFELFPQEISREILEDYLRLLHPFAPHITEELWEKIGNKPFLTLASWPVFDEKKINPHFAQQDKAVEQFTSDMQHVLSLFEEKERRKPKKGYVYVLPQEKEWYLSAISKLTETHGLELTLYVVTDQKKYDPQEKAKKVKPGKPGIYLE